MMILRVCITELTCLIFLYLAQKGLCQHRPLAIHCQWGPFGDWSACNPCTKLQSSSRAMVVYAQFGGNPCDGAASQSRICETTQRCPLEEGCGNRFRCRSGMCISKSMVCNGDQDCEEDPEDESSCNPLDRYQVCLTEKRLPPGIEDLGLGFDAVSEKPRGIVINTKSFGGQCRTIYSAVHRSPYRLPLSTLQYAYMVKVQNDFSDEYYTSKWHYAKDIVNRETVTGTTTGYHNYDFHETVDRTEHHHLVVLKNNIEIGSFQNNAPRYLPISEEFWKALAKLPTVYDYIAYRNIVERFGTHYLSEGVLGGYFNVIIGVHQESSTQRATETIKGEECVRTKRWFLIFPITTEKCTTVNKDRVLDRPEDTKINSPLRKVDVEGGDPQHVEALKIMDITKPELTWEMYSNWAESVRYFPKVLKPQYRPLSELVKEVQCAGLKRVYLRRAIEQYVAEKHPCHCQPCRNNGLVVMDGDVCKCICKPGTEGDACESGTEAEGQQGVIHGRWSCWSGWASCSQGRRSRSRSCSNPSPRNGGLFCIGLSVENSECENDELEYLKTMDPQCFDLSLPARAKCDDPPALINGYVMDPKDVYLVGSRVQYTCTNQYHLVGNSIVECTADQRWSTRPGLCTVSKCKIARLSEGVTATPLKEDYNIGDMVTLSCPNGRQLLGERALICDPSLHFSPSPTSVKCSEESIVRESRPTSPTVQCRPWEKSVRGKCICKLPFECASSLDVCATITPGEVTMLLDVCKLHALQCIGKGHNLKEDSACQWPELTTAACDSCQMWQACDDQTNMCRCKDISECLVPGINVCVRVGNVDSTNTQTMTECEAGLRKCKGEDITVVSINPC